MKKSFCLAVLILLLLLAGCNGVAPEASQPEEGAAGVSFLSSMGCNDPNCTETSHYHDCPEDCTEYDHYHNCALGCTDASHHHGGQTADGGHEGHHKDGHH